MSYGEYETLHREIQRSARQENLEQHWEQNVSADLTSERFITLLQAIPSKDRSKAIGMALQYRTSEPADEDFWKYVENLPQSFEFKSDYGEQAIRNLEISDLDNLDNKRKIFAEFFRLYNQNGYVFHGFNGVFEEDIRTKGLDTEARKWDWNELKRISDIGSKSGAPMILGWGTINSKGKIFFDRTAEHTYRYATASPEWFAQFTSEGYHIVNEPQKKEAFYRRDYQQAKQNVIDLCDRMMSSTKEDIDANKAYPNITTEERQEIMDFFEKYWLKFAGETSQPRVALIKRSSIPEIQLGPLDFDDFCETYKKTPEEVDIRWAMNEILEMEHFGVDSRLIKNVSPENLRIVDLPDYNTVNPIEGKT